MTASAPGKVILFGEHFVVYGVPAIVMAMDRRAVVTVERRGDEAIHIESDVGIAGTFRNDHYKPAKGGAGDRRILEPVRIAAERVLEDLGVSSGLNVSIRSEIPVAVGLGSSGALAVATVAAVSRLLGKKLGHEGIFRLSYEPEKFVHKYPSGIDQTISTYGGIIRYERGKAMKALRVKKPLPLVIGNTGILRSTGDLVAMVKTQRDENPDGFNKLVRKARDISDLAIKALEKNDLQELGRLMNKNQQLLEKIGVSHSELEKAIKVARKAGAWGAKLTGAGGGGCMIALAPQEKVKAVADAIRGIVEPMVVKMTRGGVVSLILK